MHPPNRSWLTYDSGCELWHDFTCGAVQLSSSQKIATGKHLLVPRSVEVMKKNWHTCMTVTPTSDAMFTNRTQKKRLTKPTCEAPRAHVKMSAACGHCGGENLSNYCTRTRSAELAQQSNETGSRVFRAWQLEGTKMDGYIDIRIHVIAAVAVMMLARFVCRKWFMTHDRPTASVAMGWFIVSRVQSCGGAMNAAMIV